VPVVLLFDPDFGRMSLLASIVSWELRILIVPRE
jgi:hypothetical protein